MTTLRLRVRALLDGKTIAVLVSGMSVAAFERLGQRLHWMVRAHGADVVRWSPGEGRYSPEEFRGFELAWIVRGGPPDQIVRVIGETLGFSLPEGGSGGAE